MRSLPPDKTRAETVPNHNRQPGRKSDTELAQALAMASYQYEHGTDRDAQLAARRRCVKYLRELSARYGLGK